MIDQARLTEDLRKLLDKELLPALRKRAEREKALDAALREEHAVAKESRRTGQAFEMWREDYLTQVGVAWVLGCVFVRFMEDNGLVDHRDHFPRIAGAGNNKKFAEDQRTDYFRRHGEQTDRDYLLWAFTDLAPLPACHELFSKAHNPLWAHDGKLMDADAATRLMEFFQQVDGKAEGKLLHDFTDASLGTRFLGDLYQNLSEAARKKYALLQTPVFVEEFILDRTLEPAIKEFGLCDQKGRELSAQKKPIPSDHLLRLIDPTVGSGHFLLGAFERLFSHWERQEPMTERAVLVERCLNSLFGVDLNPYAANIARFRLLVAALKACGIKRLREARDWTINVAVGDSLLHGSFAGGTLGGELFEAQVRTDTGNQYATSAEDLETLRRFLMPHRYHVVVGNPPYITVKDAALSEAYRRRYESCHRLYGLTVPFFERFFDLAVAAPKDEPTKAGFVGKITGNAFMKREFGKKLVELFLPGWELTHVIDTQLAHIPGHGTATAIILGRNRLPVAATVRLVAGLRREDHEPDPPESGKVWQAILAQVDRPGSQSEFVSVTDSMRQSFHSHPWSIGGGGAAELKETMEEATDAELDSFVDQIGRTTVVGEDDAWILDWPTIARRGARHVVPLCVGDCVRDFNALDLPPVIYPYDSLGGQPIDAGHRDIRLGLWPYRVLFASRTVFGKTLVTMGRPWYEHLEHYRDKLRSPLSLAFAFVATHNHFVLDRGGKVFNRSAPVIKLVPGTNEHDYLALFGLLNSAAACFWMKQVFYDKGGGGISEGVKAERWERFHEHDGTKVKRFPVPWDAKGTDNPFRTAVVAVAREIDTLAQTRAQNLPAAVVSGPASAATRPTDAPSKGTDASSKASFAPNETSRAPNQASFAPNQGSFAPNQASVGANQASKTPPDGPSTPTSGRTVPTKAALDAARGGADAALARMIALQEELDWLVYRAYGLLDNTPPSAESADLGAVPPIKLGERAFEIVMARKVEAGTLQTEWFRRHGSTPITQIPAHWPVAYKKVVEHRIALIESGPKQNKDIALIEQPEYKRRWNTEKWEEMEERALREWLLDRLEWGTQSPRADASGTGSRSSLWNEAEPQVMTTGRLADLVRTDAAFMQVAAIYRRRTDFDVSDLVSELVADESVPFLPPLRYKESGLTKRRLWERTWKLQRDEDRLEALRVAARQKLATAEAGIIERSLSAQQRAIDQLTATLARDRATLTTTYLSDVRFDESVLPEKLAAKLNRDANPACGELVDSIAAAAEKLGELQSDFRQKLTDLKKDDRAWNVAVQELDAVPANPEIEVPPRYTSADFLPGKFWNLRGKLDVPKERFVSLPHCGPDADPTMLIMWAGFDHRQQALAIATYYQDRKDNAGWDKSRFVPLLAGLLELLPWVKQWHNEPDAGGTEWGAYVESFVNDEARWLGLTLEQIRAWQPPAKAKGRRGKAKAGNRAEGDGEND